MSPRRSQNSGELRSPRAMRGRAIGAVAAAGLSVAGGRAAAEVIHVDPPDITFAGFDWYDFDVDGDSLPEMQLSLQFPDEDQPADVIAVFNPIGDVVVPLDYGSLIGPDVLNWVNTGSKPLLIDFTSLTGGFAGPDDKYMGLRFPIGGETHYGWARLAIDADSPNLDITLFEWAYESEPDTAIQTPATTNVPEPSALAGLAIGAASLLAFRAARKKRAAAIA